jgi:multidrug resistance efflux pump
MDSMASPEQLDQQVKIMRTPFYVMFLALLLGFLTLLIWSLTYNFTEGVSVGGVIFTSLDIVNITAEREAIVEDVLVEENEYIEAGDIVAVLADEDLLEELTQLQEEISEMDADSSDRKLLETKLKKKQKEYIASTMVKSDTAGYVQSVKGIGSKVEAGESILSLMPDGGYNELTAYVPLETSKSLSLGMTAQISPSYAPREEYGYMNGVITKISSVPATNDSIVKHLGSLDYVNDILPDSAVVEVRIKLDLDTDSENQYKWSNTKGESLSVGLGTQCSAQIITKEFHPITLLFS